MKPIAIFGAPRSGTTWLGQLFNSSPNCLYRYQPLFSYEFKNYLTTNSSPADIENFYKKLRNAKSEFVLTEHSFEKTDITHLVWKEVRYHHITDRLLKSSNLKIIYIERDVLSVINSWYNAPKEFNQKEWNILDEWRDAPSKNQNRPEEFNGYNKWLEVREIHRRNKKKYSDQVKIIDYNTLRDDTVKTMKDIFIFCGLNWSDQVDEFINLTKTKHVNDKYSVFKSKKSPINLPQEIIDQLNECR